MTDKTESPEEVVTHPAQTFSEAPYSGNVRTRIHGYDWQLTIRAADSESFVKKVDGLMKWLDSRTDKALNVDPPAPTVTTPAPLIPGMTGATVPAASSVQTIHAIKLQIEPRPDGKVNLNFFESGHQYPDIKATKTTAEAVSMLQPLGAWTIAHMVASEYAINAVIDWKPSTTLNKNGKPYKNIVSIAPAAAPQAQA